VIVTLTEMGARVYVADMDGQRVVYTRQIGRMIRDRGKLVWKSSDFGRGRPGRQAQYRVEEEADGRE